MLLSTLALCCSINCNVINKILDEGFCTERIIAKKTTEEDIDILANYLMDRRVSAKLDPTLIEDDLKSKRSAMLVVRELMKKGFSFSIILKDIQKPIGQVGYMIKNEMLIPSWYIAGDYQRKGYASEIVLPLTKKIFDSCDDIKTLYVAVEYDNIASLKLTEKLFAFINQHGKYSMQKEEGYTAGEVEGKTIKLHYWQLILNKEGKN